MIATANPGKLREFQALLAGLPFAPGRARSARRDRSRGDRHHVRRERLAQGASRRGGERAAPRSPMTRGSRSMLSAARPASTRRATRVRQQGMRPPWMRRNNAKLMAALAGRAVRGAPRPLPLRARLPRRPRGPCTAHHAGRVGGIHPRGAARRRWIRLRPLFLAPRAGLTAAELEPERKNRLSHRGAALRALRRALAALRTPSVCGIRAWPPHARYRSRCTCTCPGACANARTATSIRTSSNPPRPSGDYIDALIRDFEAELAGSRRPPDRGHFLRRRHAEPVRARGFRPVARGIRVARPHRAAMPR